MGIDLMGGFTPSGSEKKRTTPQRRKRARVPRQRVKHAEGRGSRLVKIVTETTRVHEPINSKDQGKPKGIMTEAKRIQLAKAMRASIKSPKTPERLKAGLRRKLHEWGFSA